MNVINTRIFVRYVLHKQLTSRRITDIVDENYVHASVLYYFGIEFYEYGEDTLEKVCNEKGLNHNVVIKELERSTICDDKVELEAFPTNLIIVPNRVL